MRKSLPEYELLAAEAHGQLGLLYHHVVGHDLAKAEKHHREAIALRERIARVRPQWAENAIAQSPCGV